MSFFLIYYNNFEYDYINDYAKASNEKLDDNLFWNNKGKPVFCFDAFYKTNSPSCKEYLKINQKIENHKKGKKDILSSCTYEVDKSLKLNKMNIETLYKGSNIAWIESVVNSIQKKIEQK